MSKLVQRIERLGKETPAPMGFGMAGRRQPQPTMALLAVTASAKAIAAAKGTPLDGVILRGKQNLAAAAKAMAALPDTPWGIQAESLTADEARALSEAGADFVALTGFGAHLDALHDDGLGRLLIVPMDLSEERARSIEFMPLDAAIPAMEAEAPLTLERLLEVATARCSIGAPFLLQVSGTLTAWELECLREAGVDGVVADLERAGGDGLSALAQAIRDLPRRRARSEPGSPLLPRPMLPGHIHHDDDEDDDPGDPDDLP